MFTRRIDEENHPAVGRNQVQILDVKKQIASTCATLAIAALIFTAEDERARQSERWLISASSACLISCRAPDVMSSGFSFRAVQTSGAEPRARSAPQQHPEALICFGFFVFFNLTRRTAQPRSVPSSVSITQPVTGWPPCKWAETRGGHRSMRKRLTSIKLRAAAYLRESSTAPLPLSGATGRRRFSRRADSRHFLMK